MGWQAVGNLVYTLVVGGLGSVIALLLATFSKFGDQLVGHAFNRNLEAIRHEFNGQIEELRVRLSVQGDRGVRANDLEYKAIITA